MFLGMFLRYFPGIAFLILLKYLFEIISGVASHLFTSVNISSSHFTKPSKVSFRCCLNKPPKNSSRHFNRKYARNSSRTFSNNSFRKLSTDSFRCGSLLNTLKPIFLILIQISFFVIYKSIKHVLECNSFQFTIIHEFLFFNSEHALYFIFFLKAFSICQFWKFLRFCNECSNIFIFLFPEKFYSSSNFEEN